MEKIQILMSTYNGEHYIREQIASILEQNYPDIELLIRDDGSKDDTPRILKDFESKYDNIHVFLEENLGSNGSFFELLRKSNAPYVGFADQDDVWLPEKVRTAYEAICGYNEPAMYFGAKKLVDSNLKEFPEQPDYKLNPGFNNAVVEAICSGCTMLMNKKLADQVRNHISPNAIYHDWWCYLIAEYLGTVVYDATPYILYRQHDHNVVGAATTFSGLVKSKARELNKRQGRLRLQLTDFKSAFYGQDKEKDKLVDAILNAGTFTGRFRILFGKGWYRQSKWEEWVVRGLFVFGHML